MKQKQPKLKCFDELSKEEKEEMTKKSQVIGDYEISCDFDTQLEIFKRLPLPRKEKINILKKYGLKW